MSFFLYEISPVDHGWDMLRTVRETMEHLVARPSDGWTADPVMEDSRLRSFLDSWNGAKRIAEAGAWEGDFTEGPFVFWLPRPDGVDLIPGFVWKQRNNGTTFVVSPVEISDFWRCHA